MKTIFDVMRRLLDSRPLHETEQAAAHAVITSTEEIIGNAVAAAGLSITPEGEIHLAGAPIPSLQLGPLGSAEVPAESPAEPVTATTSATSAG